MTFPSRLAVPLLILSGILGGTLHTASAIGLSRNYKVSVEVDGFWQDIQVYNALCTNTDHHDRVWNDWDNALQLRDTMAFALFENSFDRPTKIRVEKLDGPFRKAEVRPSAYGIKARKKGNNCLEFKIPGHDMSKVSVEFDGDRYHNLFIIGSKPDGARPDPTAPGVRYFGPGEHEIGVLRLNDGETLYADYGAILYGNIEVCGSGCTIAGHGILSGERNIHRGASYSLGKILLECNPKRAKGLEGLTIKDITLIDGPSWNLSVYNMADVVIDGVNAISWSLNGDGIDITSCHDVEIRNCFLRNYDDCITVKTRYNAYPMSDCCDVTISGCLCWNDYARGIVIGIENGNSRFHTGHIHDILVHDCIIMENSRSTDLSDLRAGFAIGLYASPDYGWGKGRSQDMENITARNITFDNIRPDGRNVAILLYPEMDGTCCLRNVTLENFRILDKLGRKNPAFEINANQHRIDGLTISNFRINGKPLRKYGDGDFVSRGDISINWTH